LESTGISVNAIHPGLARSGLMKESFAPLRLFTWLISSAPKKLAEDILPAAIAPGFETTTGRLLYRGREIEAPTYAYDREAQQRLWDSSETLTALASTKDVMPVNDPHI